MKRAVFWPILIVVTVFVVSGQSELATPPSFGWRIDLLAHFAVFGALATSILRIPAVWRMGGRGVLLAIVLTSVYGGLDELRQSFTPGRFMQFDDWVADTLGATFAACLYWKWTAYRKFLEMPNSECIRRIFSYFSLSHGTQ
ncbi:MAG: VanZ family protein [Verrucomicrobia bacterium]|nr:VanZ family protein [Verrucomicrobiota bacterium]MCH8511197.1 VanZ family protein [Kiritimatiellia bacterium]